MFLLASDMHLAGHAFTISPPCGSRKKPRSARTLMLHCRYSAGWFDALVFVAPKTEFFSRFMVQSL